MIKKLTTIITVLGCFFLSLFSATLITPPLALAISNDQSRAEITSPMKALQVPFIANEGQLDKRVAFSARTLGGNLFVTTAGDLVYSFSQPLANQRAVIRERLIGGIVDSVKGVQSSPTIVNYFRGQNPKKWVQGIGTYMEVSLGEVYEGIELRLKAYNHNVEKLFYVAPGAVPEQIRLNVSGADSLEVNDEGLLVLTTPVGSVAFTRPVAWQEIGDSRVPVTAEYELVASADLNTEYTFAIGPYDPTHPLVIDPLLASTFLGSSGDDTGHSIGVDSEGNVYVTGETSSTGFPVDVNDTSYNGGDRDVFVSKLSADLTTLIASTFIGGAGNDIAFSLALDASNNVYIAGTTSSSGYPVNAYDTTFNTSGGLTDGFVTKLSSDLSSIVASTFLGGANTDECWSLGISSGNIFVTGYTESTNFPTIEGSYDRSHNENQDIFVAKFTSNLSVLSASTFIGGGGFDYGRSLDFDSGGNVFVVGNTTSSDFPSNTGLDITFGGGPQVMVAKLPSNLSALTAASVIGSEGFATGGSCIAVDSSGNVFLTGWTDASNYPTTEGAYDRTANSFEAFVTRLNNDLDTIMASTLLGTGSWDRGHYLVLDDSDNVYVTGFTNSTDFPTTLLAYDRSHNGSDDVFITKFQPDLTAILTSTLIGSNGTDWGRALVRDASGNIYVTGNTYVYSEAYTYPTTAGAYDRSWNTGKDVFISILDSELVGPSVQFSAANYNVNETGTQVTITVTRVGDNSGAVSVQYDTSDDTALDGSDYTAASGTLNWADGDSADKTFTASITDDSLVEGSEVINLTLSNATGIVIGPPQTATITIIDDEVPGGLRFSEEFYYVNEDDGTVTIAVMRTGGSDGAVSVQYATSDGSAVDGTDYNATSGTLNWLAGDIANKTFTVDLIDNSNIDGDKDLILSLSNPTNGAELVSPHIAYISILDDESAGSLQFSLESFAVSEDVGSAVVTVTRTGGSDGTVTVDYTTSDDTAIDGSDYTAKSGTLSWADGDASEKTFSVAIIDDSVREGEEKVTLTLDSQTGSATLGTQNVANINITDDDLGAPGSLQFSQSSYQVWEDGSQATITVIRSGGSDQAVTVDYTASDGTAAAGEDYTGTSGTLSWNDLETNSKTFNVPIFDDEDDENNETLTLTLSDPVGGAVLGTTDSATLTILDNDTLLQHGTLQFSVPNYYVWENGGTFNVTVTRTNGDDGEVTVDFATGDGTAVVGGDYEEFSGMFTWADGETEGKTFSVTIINDTEYEGDETINLSLTSPTGGAVLGTNSTATLTINDNEPPPEQNGSLQFSSSTYSVDEPAGQVIITVTRTGGSDGDISVHYETSDGTAMVTDDYDEDIGDLDWSDGETANKTIVLGIQDDSAEEGDETVMITLSAPVGGATLGSPQSAIVTIEDDESQSVVTIPMLNLLLGE